ncbi:hypothetical protein NQ315_007856 [Exocentrus adspersus]|uniref:THAP-type domain-containing protein n=1 Tax=Exocentrus adspersus TaxID=1586481 RepID=A0AAV8W9B8_9CUCU|nr:hypothetical protein NQ315_007856 [Exocentrus adspersus]
MYAESSKWCFVPNCGNTSINAPNKVFVTLPSEYSRKLKWFKAAKRDMPKSKSIFYCCEDHFNVLTYVFEYVLFEVAFTKSLEVMLARTAIQPPNLNHRSNLNCQSIWRATKEQRKNDTSKGVQVDFQSLGIQQNQQEEQREEQNPKTFSKNSSFTSSRTREELLKNL